MITDIFDYIDARCGVSIAQIAVGLDRPRREITSEVMKLLKQGRIISETGGDGVPRYEVNPEYVVQQMQEPKVKPKIKPKIEIEVEAEEEKLEEPVAVKPESARPAVKDWQHAFDLGFAEGYREARKLTMREAYDAGQEDVIERLTKLLAR